MSTVRAIGERALLLREMEKLARGEQNEAAAETFADLASEAEKRSMSAPLSSSPTT